MKHPFKRLFSYAWGALAAFAFPTAAQTTYLADTFENIGEGQGSTNGAVDMPISEYKCQPYGAYYELTNYLWQVESPDDRSKIVAGTSPYAGSVRPVLGSTTQMVMNLETNGKTLVRTNGASLELGSSPIYMDTLVMFTPSTDIPTVSNPRVKAAVFLVANLHLWVYHGGTYVATDNTASDTGLVVSTNEWHRLTILMSKMPESISDYAFKVYIDQQLVSCAAGMQDDCSPDGPWFYSASTEGTFAAVAFQGTGMVDELVVTDMIGPPSALTLVFNDALLDVMCGGQPVASNGQIPDGSTVSINATDWYEIDSVTGSCICVTYSGPAGVQVNTSTGQLMSGHSASVFITARRYTGTYSTGAESVDAGKLASWALAYSKSEAEVTAHAEEWLDDYLMNVDANTNPILSIDSVTLSETEVTLVVKATGGVDFADINGIVNICTSDNLQTFTSSGPTYVTVAAGSQATVVVPKSAGTFFKASVETADLTPR